MKVKQIVVPPVTKIGLAYQSSGSRNVEPVGASSGNCRRCPAPSESPVLRILLHSPAGVPRVPAAGGRPRLGAPLTKPGCRAVPEFDRQRAPDGGLPGYDRAFNTLTGSLYGLGSQVDLREELAPEALQPQPTLPERAAAAGLPIHYLGPAFSGFRA